MKNIAKVAAAVALALMLLSAPYTIEAVTTDLELVGDAAGLVLAPAGGKLFDLRNMNPGDERTAKITIRNSYTDLYGLWLQAVDVMEEDPGLFGLMEMTVLYRGEVLYEGPVDGFAAGKIFLGLFQPGESGELVVTVHLPGPETGNEYQGKSAGVKWVFTARASEQEEFPPEDPGVTPEDPGDLPRTYGAMAAGALIGGLALLVGSRLVRGRKGR